MTFVGKILVIAIMAFALLFLGISTVVFTTHTNWKDETGKQRELVKTANKQKSELQALLDNATKDLATAKSEHEKQLEVNKKRNDQLEQDVKAAIAEDTSAKGELEKALQSSQTALAEAEERRNETNRLREQKSAVEKQANDYKLQQTELNDKIRELERQNKSLDENGKVLRDKVAGLSTLLRSKGLSDDISTIRGQGSPPPVQGEVAHVDSNNKNVETTIGSDDGVLPGHELYLYRVKPQPAYLGKIKIISVDPDQSVGTVIGKTYQGKKIQEGDIVSSTLRPRS